MSFTRDDFLDPDEALRLLDLALPRDTGQDLVLMIESKGSVVEGESKRQFEDGKTRMDALGYQVISWARDPGGAGKSRVTSASLIVVRNCDAATASIASLLKSQANDLKVVLSVFKAGGDNSADAQPTLEIVAGKARVAVQGLVTSQKLDGPCEIVYFQFESCEIRSAPQTGTGTRGAVRTCTFTA